MPTCGVDFTVRSAALAREFTDSHHVPADIRELVANAIAMHYTPGVGLESGAEAYLHRFAMSDLSIRLAPFRG